MPFATTATMNIAFETGGLADGVPVLLLHGWPDDARTYDRVVPALHAAGLRTIVPYLRGFGDTSFLSRGTMRSGEMVAMAQDAIDLADALGDGLAGFVGEFEQHVALAAGGLFGFGGKLAEFVGADVADGTL